MTDLIKLERVDKMYKGSPVKALENITLEVKEREFFCLVGESGSGKSTILKLIAGIEKPTSGTVTAPRNVGMVFQLGALLPWLTVEENVIFGLKMKGTSSLKDQETAKKYLEMVKLENFEKKYPRELSGGQRQRVGIARALAIEPEILLLDEPFSALDPFTTQDLYEDLLSIWRQTKKTIVMVSHYLEEAVLLSDRIGAMKDGKLIGVIENDLPRPRNLGSNNFESKIQEIRSKIL